LEINSHSNIENFANQGDDISYILWLDRESETECIRHCDLNACTLRRLTGQPVSRPDILWR
jgi:hypothetical protein